VRISEHDHAHSAFVVGRWNFVSSSTRLPQIPALGAEGGKSHALRPRFPSR
jgi:hypothetical protein